MVLLGRTRGIQHEQHTRLGCCTAGGVLSIWTVASEGVAAFVSA